MLYLHLRNNVRDLVEPILPCVAGFERASRDEPDIMNSKKVRIKEPCIADIERTIYEYIPIEV